MIAHAAGIELDEITTTWDKWVTPVEITTAKGVIPPGNVAAVRFTINGVFQGEPRIVLEHVNRVGVGPPRTGRRATTTTSTGWTSRAARASPRRRSSGSPTAPGVTPQPPVASPPGCAH